MQRYLNHIDSYVDDDEDKAVTNDIREGLMSNPTLRVNVCKSKQPTICLQSLSLSCGRLPSCWLGATVGKGQSWSMRVPRKKVRRYHCICVLHSVTLGWSTARSAMVVTF